jgi:peroxiredoxin
VEEQKDISQQALSAEAVRQLNLCLGLSVASLVLGILAVAMSIMLVGILLGIIGLILGIIYLGKRNPLGRSIAIWGLSLSIVGIAASVVFGCLFVLIPYLAYKQMNIGSESGGALEEWIGREAPDFTVTDLQGKEITLSNFKGKRVILDFWATWCPPCRKEIPHFIKLRENIGDDALFIIGISSESSGVLRKFVETNKINYPIASATDLPEPYSKISSIPTTLFIDRSGIIQKVAVGGHDYSSLFTYATLSDYAVPNEPNMTQ